MSKQSQTQHFHKIEEKNQFAFSILAWILSTLQKVGSRHCLEKKYRINVGLVALQISMGVRYYDNASSFGYRVRTQTGMVLFTVSSTQRDIILHNVI